jgi:hypothetical protein
MQRAVAVRGSRVTARCTFHDHLSSEQLNSVLKNCAWKPREFTFHAHMSAKQLMLRAGECVSEPRARAL